MLVWIKCMKYKAIHLPTACFLKVKNAIMAATEWMKMDENIAHKKTLYHISKEEKHRD